MTTLWGQAHPWLPWTVCICASFVSAVTDVRYRRIPNAVTGPVLLGGLIWAGLWEGATGLADASAGCGLLALPFVVLFLLGGGAGDAKLMGALGAWLGVVGGLVVLAAVSVCGVVLGIGFAAVKRRSRAVLGNVTRAVFHLFLWVSARGRLPGPAAATVRDLPKMPYGTAIFLGVCIAAGAVLIWHMR
jgi:prepilin peptidase CpaA